MIYRQILVAAHSLPVAFAFVWSDCRAVDMLYLQGQVPTAQKAIAAYGTELFGDTVNLYDGSLSIQHTDLSLRGNNELPVSLTRTISPGKSERWTALNRPLGDWAWALPRIGGTFATNTGWRGQDGSVGTRCSQFAPPAEEVISGPDSMSVETPPPGPGVVLSDHQHSVELPGGGRAGPAPMAATYFVPADSFWHGMFLEVPGQGAQEVLKRRTQPHPGYERAPAGGPFPLVTKDNWAIGCLATIKNGAGQGFYAISPSGVRYDFDWLVTRATDPVKFTSTTLQRQDIHLYASKVTDRFGNWVQYSFNAANPALLTKITSSENPSRTITVAYTNGRASSASDGARSVSYIYNGSTLHKVTVPGNRQWVFDLGPLIPELLGWNSEPVACGDASDGQRPVIPGPGTITHPSGALLTLSTQFVLHAKTAVPFYCYLVDGSYRRTYPPNYLNAAVTAKSITGPGLPAMNWGFGYSDAWETGDPPEVFRRIVTVAEPDGSSTRHFFGNRWQNNEGQLLKVQKGWSGGQAALKTTSHEYRELTPFGTTILGDKGDYLGSHNVPLSRLTTDQQGRQFIWAVGDPSGFDEFARPISVSKSGPGGSRIEVTTYEDKLDLWALGQVKTLKHVNASGTVLHTMAEHEYNAKGQPLTHKAFGITQSTQTWNADGTLATKKPGSSAHTTTYSNYKRGIAQNVSYPTGASESVVVDNLGRITSFTSAAAFTTGFGYDTAGHLNRITPPPGFTATTLLFEPATAAAYGLPIGHWRQTISKGSARTITYFDAFWRPVMTRSYDATSATTEAATRKVVVKRYAAGGELSFESYPQRDIASVATSTPGKRMWHDALDRPTRLEADSELSPSVLGTDTEYLSDFKVKTTDPKGHISEQTLWALDKPEEAKISAITAALGLTEAVTTSIQRDVFGKPTRITRGAVTRSYVYDAGQRLCKTIEPEVGATIQTYDSAGNVAWRAPGQTFTGTSSCDDASVTTTSRIVFGYDELGQLLSTSYGDGSPAVTRTYWPDGPLKTVATAAISATPATSWSYTYNGLRQLTQESLVFDGKTYSFVRGYNASGDATTLSYPTTVTGSPSLAYTPNALGEPTQVGSYASSLKFHPNGAVAEFKYGNTLQHSLSQNTRQLPERQTDGTLLKDLYAYDRNGNVTGITDEQLAQFTRSMTYDGLDRLKTANAPGVWGNASYSYDAVDNLTVADVGARTVSLAYDAKNRLSTASIKWPGEANPSLVAYGYDARGNITGKGPQSYAFDLGNRLKSVGSTQGYVYDGHGRRVRVIAGASGTRIQVYTNDGKLMWSTNSATGSSTAYIYLGGKQIAEWEKTASTTTTRYLHTDALGSPVARSNSSGGLINRTRYEAYGNVAAGVEPGPGVGLLGFTGHVQDPETDLVYMQQRYYDPIGGRFLSVDPVVTDADTGRQFGRYHYAENNPYAYTDPDGRLACGPNGDDGGRCVRDIDRIAKEQRAIDPSRWIPQFDGGDGGGKSERPLTGAGHHKIPNETINRLGIVSPSAIKVFDGVEGRIPVENHNGARPSPNSVTHAQYNKLVLAETAKWMANNKVDPAKMTGEQAKDLLRHMRTMAPAEIRQFNQVQYSKALQQAMRRSWYSKPIVRTPE